MYIKFTVTGYIQTEKEYIEFVLEVVTTSLMKMVFWQDILCPWTHIRECWFSYLVCRWKRTSLFIDMAGKLNGVKFLSVSQLCFTFFKVWTENKVGQLVEVF